MPARVVLVKRVRRRAFGLLRSASAWLTSLAGSLAGRRPNPIQEWEAAGVPIPLRPALVFGAERTSRCTACGSCVPVCPSGCLVVEGDERGLTRFELDLGACIGCGHCVEICPETALASVPVPAALASGIAGRGRRWDLLGSAQGDQGSAPSEATL